MTGDRSLGAAAADAEVGTARADAGDAAAGPRVVAGICAALAALAVAVYARTVGFAYVNIDDAFYAFENPHVLAGLRADGVAWAFSTFEQANWHPLTWISHMLDVSLFGPAPAGPHAVNVAFHAANTLLLFAWLRSATGATWRTALVAAIFAVHPLHVESVAWVSERKDVLCTFLWFLSIWTWVAWVRSRRRAAWAASVLLCAAALLAKPTAVTHPFALLLLDAWPLRRTGPQGPGLAALVREKLPLFALSAASCVVTYIAQSTAAVAGLERLPLGARLVNAVVSWATYAARAVWPADLAMPYPHPSMFGGSHSAWTVAGSAALVVAVSAAAWGLRASRPYVAWGWCWFLGTLVPVIGLVQVGIQALADRYTYVPLVGLSVAVAWILAGVAGSSARRRTVAAGAAVAAVAALAVAGTLQADHWKDSLSLHRRAVAVSERNAVAWSSLGDALVERGEADEAVAAYRRAVELRPDMPSTRAHLETGLGLIAGRAGRHAEAAAHFEASLALEPNFATNWFNLGASRARMGQFDVAEAAFLEALRLRPTEMRALIALCVVRLDRRDREGALEACERLRPHDPVRAAEFRAEALALPPGSRTAPPR